MHGSMVTYKGEDGYQKTAYNLVSKEKLLETGSSSIKRRQRRPSMVSDEFVTEFKAIFHNFCVSDGLGEKMWHNSKDENDPGIVWRAYIHLQEKNCQCYFQTQHSEVNDSEFWSNFIWFYRAKQSNLRSQRCSIIADFLFRW